MAATPLPRRVMLASRFGSRTLVLAVALRLSQVAALRDHSHSNAEVAAATSEEAICDVKEFRNIKNAEFSPPDSIKEGSAITFACKPGYMPATDDTFSEEYGYSYFHGEVRSVEIFCDADYQLRARDFKRTLFDKFVCLRDCGGDYEPPMPGVRPFYIDGVVGLEGYSMSLSRRYQGFERKLFGSDRVYCDADGTYKYGQDGESGPPPVAAALCPKESLEEFLQEHPGLKVVGETMSSSPLTSGLYDKEIAPWSSTNSSRTHVLQGTHFEFTCVAPSRLLVGDGGLTCGPDGTFGDALNTECAASAKIRVIAVEIGDLIPEDEVDYYKLKLFRGSATKGDTKKKGYQDEAKFTPDKFGHGVSEVTASSALSDTYLHLTVCAKGGKEKAFSNCKVGATTLAPTKCPECSVARLIKKAGAKLEPIAVSLPIGLKNEYKRDDVNSPQIKVKLLWVE